MTLAEKDFKNIYESGIKELTDIGISATERAKDSREDYSKKHKEATQKSLSHLEEESESLQAELKLSIKESLRKLQNRLSVENSQSEASLDGLITELKTLTEQMKTKLDSLKESHKGNVSFAHSVAIEDCKSGTEQACFSMEQALSSSLQSLTDKANADLEELNANLDKAVSGIQRQIGNVTDSNILSLKEYTATISTHANALLKAFHTDSQTKLNSLEGVARRAKADLDSSTASLFDVIASHAGEIEQEASSMYEETSSVHTKSVNELLNQSADQLASIRETTKQNLEKTTDELSDDLVSQSKKVQDDLRRSSDDAANVVKALFGSFKDKLNDRLELNRGQKQALEIDKNRIVSAVRNELVSIEKEFAGKIEDMLGKSVSDMVALTNSIEEQIRSETEILSNQIAKNTQTAQRQIDAEVNRILQEISSARLFALGEIAAAAQGNLNLKNATEQNVEESSTPSEEKEFLEHGSQSMSGEEVSTESVAGTNHVESEEILSIEPEQNTESESDVPRHIRRRKDRK